MTVHGRRRTLRAGVVAATALVAGRCGDRRGARVEARRQRDQCLPRRSRRACSRCPRPASRAAATSSRCSGTSAAPPDRPGQQGQRPQVAAPRRGTACTTVSGLPGVLVVRTEAGGVVTFDLPSRAALGGATERGSERDRLRPGRRRRGRLRRALQRRARRGRARRARARASSTAPTAPSTCAEPLSGALAPGAYLVVPVDRPERLPGRCRALRHGAPGRRRRALVRRRDRARVRSAAFAHTLVEGNRAAGGRRRLEHGRRARWRGSRTAGRKRRRERLGVHDDARRPRRPM